MGLGFMGLQFRVQRGIRDHATIYRMRHSQLHLANFWGVLEIPDAYPNTIIWVLPSPSNSLY